MFEGADQQPVCPSSRHSGKWATITKDSVLYSGRFISVSFTVSAAVQIPVRCPLQYRIHLSAVQIPVLCPLQYRFISVL
jgi:hypothetical protein